MLAVVLGLVVLKLMVEWLAAGLVMEKLTAQVDRYPLKGSNRPQQ